MELILGYLCIGLLIACMAVVLNDPTDEKSTYKEK